MIDKIAIVIPYFGSFPNYFELWLESASFNPKINYLIFTDINTDSYSAPANVFFFKTTLVAIKKRIIYITKNTKIVLNKPYKLCDFKLLYRMIFEDELKKYRFWGYGDLDIVWGNALMGIDKNVLDSYEKINFRGHFCFYKNDDYTRELFFASDLKSFFDANYVIHTNYCCHYDELVEWQEKFERDSKKVYTKVDYSDISYHYYPFRMADFNEPERANAPQIYLWNQGRLYQYYVVNSDIKVKEVSYIHLQKRKMSMPPFLDFSKPILIAPNYFENIDLDKINVQVINENSVQSKINTWYWKKRVSILYEKLKTGAIRYRINSYLRRKD